VYGLVLTRFIHDSTCCDAPGPCIRDVLLGRASSPVGIDKPGEFGCGALGRETPRLPDLEPSRDDRVMNNPGLIGEMSESPSGQLQGALSPEG